MVIKSITRRETRFVPHLPLIPALVLIALFLATLSWIDHAIADQKKADNKTAIEAFLQALDGINTDKIEARLNDYENMSVDRLDLRKLELEIERLKGYSKLCKENWRKVQDATAAQIMRDHLPGLRAYSLTKKMIALTEERDRKHEEIRSREVKAYRDKFGWRYQIWNDSRWPKTPKFEAFHKEKEAVEQWYLDRKKELVRDEQLGNPKLVELIDEYREEVKRQCLFVTSATYRVERLIAIKKGIRPAEAKEGVKKEAKKEYIKIQCDRTELYEGEIANCTAWHYVRGLAATPVRRDTGELSWKPAVVSNGFVYGREVKEKHELPYTFDVEAAYTPWGEKKSFEATVSLTVKPRPTRPAIALRVTTDSNYVSPGDLVKYTYDITNTGDVPLTGLSITDDQCPKLGMKSKTLKIDPKARL